jgi:hypothetical protein
VVADVVGQDARRRHEALGVAVLEEGDHRLPDLPDAEGERADLGTDPGGREAVEVRLPPASGDL